LRSQLAQGNAVSVVSQQKLANWPFKAIEAFAECGESAALVTGSQSGFDLSLEESL
jgi:hypothetical protein